MMKHETHFVTHAELIVIGAIITGPRASVSARFVLDTGAVYTTITPEVADVIGYSARDGIRRTRVRTAVGSEQGYLLVVAKLSVFGGDTHNFPVHVFELGHDAIDGLLGLNFLSHLNCEVRSAERRILVEPARPRP